MAGGKLKLAPTKTTGIQYGALPWRLRGDEVQILLITSRRTRRWIIPKGWPMDGLKPQDAAAREAQEEAGVFGEISARPIGQYRYAKTMRNGHQISCRVEVFPLKVALEEHDWAEMDARERRWVSVPDAIASVHESQLKALIRRFASRINSQMRRK
jgi:8-oxo-dGTP pyrophosphatase MutT (NUDIX family)